jgi:uroporphyrinogen-III synthase
MKKKNKIESKKLNKVERITDSAAKLFSEKNFHEVMMEDVAITAGVAKGTLYNYFNSKEDLYFSIMLSRMENLVNHLKENISGKSSPIYSLHSFVIHNYMFMIKYDSFFNMFRKDSFKAANKSCEELKIKKNELCEILSGILKDGINKNLFVASNAPLAVDMTMGSIYGAVERGIKNKLTKSKLHEESENLFEIILKGLIPENSEQMLPLKGKTIVLARSADDSKDSVSKLQKLGASVVSFPTLEITPTDDWTVFDSVIKNFDQLDFLIFTSAKAVKYFSDRSTTITANLKFDNVKIIAVGKKTAEACEEKKIPVDIIPEEFSALGIIQSLSKLNIKDKNIFIPGSEIARKELPENLKKLGAKVTTASIYKVKIPHKKIIERNIAELKSSKPELYIFTSPSTFKNFLEILKIKEPPKFFNGNDIAAIGLTTKKEIEKYNIDVKIVPKEYTMDGLIETVKNYYTNNK